MFCNADSRKNGRHSSPTGGQPANNIGMKEKTLHNLCPGSAKNLTQTPADPWKLPPVSGAKKDWPDAGRN
jgi:hypothetical protein